MAEIWDIYDSNRIKTGKTIVKGESIAHGEYTAKVMVLVFDGRGNMLIQRRLPDVGWMPGMWGMTAGGSIISGETPAKAAARELYEEVGIKIDFTNSHPDFNITFGDVFIDYYLVTMTSDLDLTTLPVPNEEVQAVKWATKEEMLKMIEKGECIPYRPSFMEFCFAIATEDMLFN